MKSAPRNKEELFKFLDEYKSSNLSNQEQQNVWLGLIEHLFKGYSLEDKIGEGSATDLYHQYCDKRDI